MRLLRLGKRNWTVLVVTKGRFECPVLDLLEASGDPGERLLSDLKEYVPNRGPPKNSEASKPLRDKILEFREPVTKGGTLRLLYFYDEGHVVVCANGVLKKSDKTPDDLIDAAVAIRTAYVEARESGQLEIVPLSDDPEYGDKK